MIYHPSEVIKNTLLEKPLKTSTALKQWAEEAQKNLFSRRMNESGNTMIDVAVAMAIGLIVLVAVYSLAPLIGSNIDSAATIPAGSQWNATENTDIPTGVEIWEQNAGLLTLAVMVSILAMIIWAIMRIRGNSGSGGGI